MEGTRRKERRRRTGGSSIASVSKGGHENVVPAIALYMNQSQDRSNSQVPLIH